jgi:hypothetical protein
MVKSMSKRKRLIRGGAVFMTLVAVLVRAIMRKKIRPRITYGPKECKGAIQP